MGESERVRENERTRERERTRESVVFLIGGADVPEPRDSSECESTWLDVTENLNNDDKK